MLQLMKKYTSPKVYKSFSLHSEKSKFPMKLSNSLVIDITPNEEPVIKKENRVVWQGVGGWTSSEISFTVTKNNDTYLYYKTGAGGTESVEVIGVNHDGKIFMNKTFGGDGAAMHARFMSSSIIEIGIEGYSPYYDGSTASKQPGRLNRNFISCM